MILRRMAQFESAIGGFHSFMQRAQPLLETVETLAANTVPGAAPVVNAVSELQQIVTDFIGAVDNHFGPGKIALPPAPTAPVS